MLSWSKRTRRHKTLQKSTPEMDGHNRLLPLPQLTVFRDRKVTGSSHSVKASDVQSNQSPNFCFLPFFSLVCLFFTLFGVLCIEEYPAALSNTHLKFLLSTLLTRMCKPSAPKEKMTGPFQMNDPLDRVTTGAI